jgi:hypothetical protein
MRHEMNCPECGFLTAPDQKFCRSCGASLQMTTQPLGELTATSQKLPTANSQGETKRVNGLVLWGLIIMFIGVAMGVTGKKLMHEEIVTFVGILVSLAGMFLTAYPYVASPRREKSHTNLSSQPGLPAQSPRPKSLNPERDIEYLPSITERTTGLLTNSATTRSREEEDS